MPAIVRGGGGGKNTKDATAVPGDVRSGKTFYGANGKQTGIWTPKVTDYTGDATAIPSDVAKGKVFYNSQGRQVGNAEVFPYYTVTIPKGTQGKRRNASYKYLLVGGYKTDWFDTPVAYIPGGKESTIVYMSSAIDKKSTYDISVSPNIDVKTIRKITITIGTYVFNFNFFLKFRGTGKYAIELTSDEYGNNIYIDEGMSGYCNLFIDIKNDVITEIGFYPSSTTISEFKLRYDCSIAIS